MKWLKKLLGIEDRKPRPLDADIVWPRKSTPATITTAEVYAARQVHVPSRPMPAPRPPVAQVRANNATPSRARERAGETTWPTPSPDVYPYRSEEVVRPMFAEPVTSGGGGDYGGGGASGSWDSGYSSDSGSSSSGSD